MLIDLTLKGSRVLIIGAGKVGIRKARIVLGESKEVTLASEGFNREARKLGLAGARLVQVDVNDDRALRRLLSGADLAIAATDDHALNRKVAQMARSLDVMIGSVDDPADSDFNFPAMRAVGDIRVGVTTGGRSPAMAAILCKRLAGSITREDRLRVELMSHVRASAKKALPTPAARRSAVYKILRDGQVRRLVRRGRLAEAEAAADLLVGGD